MTFKDWVIRNQEEDEAFRNKMEWIEFMDSYNLPTPKEAVHDPKSN